MKYISAIVVLLLCSFSVSAQANESGASYVFQKQLKANNLRRESELKIQALRSLPKNGTQLVNITPMAGTDEMVMQPPSPEDLNAIETAAGRNPSKSTATKVAKLSMKK